MANNPKKIKDPTDTALTAIQEVLSTADQPSSSRSDTAGEPIAPPPRESGRRGARTAAPERRHILFVSDGSFLVTAAGAVDETARTPDWIRRNATGKR